MKIVFWQNVLSIHQEALLVALAERVEVWLVYEEELYKNRKAMGWSIPEFNGVKLVPIDDIQNISNGFLQNLDYDYHIFSGINAYPKISKYFNFFYKKNPSRLACFLEKPGGSGSRLESYFRLLKYKYYALKYKKLKYLLTPGGEEYLWNAGFKKEKIIPFAYFGPETTVNTVENVKNNNIIEFVYVGSLSKRKNVGLVFQALKTYKNTEWHMSVVGDGEECESLMQLVESLNLSKQITFLGNKSNNEVQQILFESDYLFLPSLHDGWGYVVNEALSKGCSVICSDACGASSIVKDCKGSYVFSSGSVKKLTNILNRVVAYGPLTVNDKKKTVEFFEAKLSGFSGSKFLLEKIQ